jgi:hypothetical protein
MFHTCLRFQGAIPGTRNTPLSTLQLENTGQFHTGCKLLEQWRSEISLLGKLHKQYPLKSQHGLLQHAQLHSLCMMVGHPFPGRILRHSQCKWQMGCLRTARDHRLHRKKRLTPPPLTHCRQCHLGTMHKQLRIGKTGILPLGTAHMPQEQQPAQHLLGTPLCSRKNS